MANLTGPNHLMIGEAKCSQGFMSWDRERNFSVSVPKLVLVDDWQTTKWIPNQEKTWNWCTDTRPVYVTWRNLAFSDPLSTDVDLTEHCSHDWLVSPMYDIHFATTGCAGELRDEKPLLTCIPEQFQFNYYNNILKIFPKHLYVYMEFNDVINFEKKEIEVGVGLNFGLEKNCEVLKITFLCIIFLLSHSTFLDIIFKKADPFILQIISFK